MTNYEYEAEEYAEIARVMRGALTVSDSLKRVTLQDDFGGVDVQFVINQHVPVALRIRRDRPAYAADIDVTFRHTEPFKIQARTYAPLAFFGWFHHHRIVAAKIVDVYRMDKAIVPRLQDRPVIDNGDGTGFVCVEIAELHTAKALLRLYDGNHWTTQILAGEIRLRQIISRYERGHGPTFATGTGTRFG